MANKEMTVSDGLAVGLEYTLRLDNGETIDSSAGRGPLDFLQGEGQIIPGLEQALYGMAVGEEKSVVVQPEDGYGRRDSTALQQIPLDSFPSDVNPEAGMALELVDDSGQSMLAFVAEVGPDQVLIDMNHPLAGETLHFDVRIATLRAATSEELAHGHVHGHGHEH
jgi:FKBP-type peptidyl-prolyl cis-trans isomerase SlyD